MLQGGFPSELDHLLVAVPTLEEGIAMAARKLGVTPVEGGRHPQWGTHNALLALGPRRYLEILALDPRADASACARGAKAFGLDSVETPRVSGWCAACSDLPGRVRAAAEAGLDLGRPIDGGRDRPDGTRVAWRITPPLMHGDGLVPFFIDFGASEHPAVAAPRGCRLRRLEAEHPDPERIWRLLAAAGVRLSVSRGPRPRLIASIEGPGGPWTIADAAPRRI